MTPYTHEDHEKPAVVAFYRGEALGLKTQFVQAMVGKVVCCARIVKAWETSDGLEMWQLALLGPIYGRMSAPTHRVRKCSGIDGACSCVAIDLVPGKESLGGGARACDSAAASAVLSDLPDGNHGETPPEGTE